VSRHTGVAKREAAELKLLLWTGLAAFLAGLFIGFGLGVMTP
jgi:hypothetical protein